MNYFIGTIFFYFLFINNFILNKSTNFELTPYLNIFNNTNLNKDSNQNSKSIYINKNHHLRNNDIEIKQLKTNNLISLKGIIDETTVNKFLIEFILHKNKENLYIYIDSTGGTVEDGYKIVTEFQKYNVSCIAEKAYSMAFVIFQTCHNRFLVPHGKLMQHQISFSITNDFERVKNYIEFINQIEKDLLNIQSSRIGMSSKKLKNKINNEWWMFGKNAIKQNCADKIINVECNEELIDESYIINDGYYYYIYSKCPIISHYLNKIEIVQ